MKKFKLSTSDRVFLHELLPRDSQISGSLHYSRLKMSLLIDLKDMIKFTPQEIEVCEIQENERGELSFFDRIEKEYEFSDQQIDIIKEGISQADQEERFTEKMFMLANKFDPIK